jgi:peptide/nickel transport system substrate-binding protein
MIPGAVYNECHVNDPAYTSLFKTLLKTTEFAKQRSIVAEMQQLEFAGNASGYIIPYFLPQIDGYAASVHGLKPSRTGIPFGGADFKQLWVS